MRRPTTPRRSTRDLASAPLGIICAWVPSDAAEIERAALAGELVETPHFDAKADLPPAKKNASLATDVAAMSTDGGVLLYGVAEDEHRRPTRPEPISLAGVAERIDQIVSTSIAEVPRIEIKPYPLPDDPSRGYVVAVPPSPRAPHQVTVGGDLRFYGRSATGNRLLNEGDVARLYERRRRWQIDATGQLAKLRANPPWPLTEGRGYLQAFAYPVMPDLEMWSRAQESAGDRNQLCAELAAAARNATVNSYSPHFADAMIWRPVGGDVWALDTDPDGDRPRGYGGVRAEVSVDGRGELFMARAAETDERDPSGLFILWEAMIAGNLAGFLAMMGRFYGLAGYFGPVAVGVTVYGIKGARSSTGRRGFIGDGRPYGKDEFERVHPVGSATELADARPLALRIVQNLVNASTGVEGFDPLT